MTDKPKLGPTGVGADPRIPGDRGGLNAALSSLPDGRLRLDFGTSLTFVIMTPDEAQALAVGLMQRVMATRKAQLKN